MDEYISKEATIDAIKKIYCPQCNNYNGAMCRACEHMDDMDIIEDMPAADVQSVKHGEWKINSDGYYPYCSVCGTAADQLTKHLTKFCPECGTRMDGDDV